jgi:hypothetical protein
LILSAELLQKSIAVEVDASSVELLTHRADGPLPSTTRAQAFVRNQAAEWQELVDRELGGRRS